MEITPFYTFLCKITSRCNLDCDYCYVYHRADQSWRRQPHKMSLETAAQLGMKINEHALAHGMKQVGVTLHGGEPLLATVDYLRRLCLTIKENAPAVKVIFSMQTNGTLFDGETLDFCLEWNIRIGLSFDGPRSVNDRHRLDFGGRSSFDAVERALQLLTSDKGRPIWSGFLAVIDITNDPLEVYSYLKSFHPTSMDFLMPLCHHDFRPPGKEHSLEVTPYADWLLKIFDVWYHEKPQRLHIRRFRDIIALMFGMTDSSEELGLAPINFIVVETNGEMQAVDSLKITYPGACDLNLNIFEHSFDDALQSPAVIERQLGLASLCQTCQQCDLVKVCGAGYFPHRYSHQHGFQNPSVYCSDLMKMIRTIHTTVVKDLKSTQ